MVKLHLQKLEENREDRAMVLKDLARVALDPDKEYRLIYKLGTYGDISLQLYVKEGNYYTLADTKHFKEDSIENG